MGHEPITRAPIRNCPFRTCALAGHEIANGAQESAASPASRMGRRLTIQNASYRRSEIYILLVRVTPLIRSDLGRVARTPPISMAGQSELVLRAVTFAHCWLTLNARSEKGPAEWRRPWVLWSVIARRMGRTR